MRLQGTTVSGAVCTVFLVSVVYNTLKNSALCHKMEIKCIKKYVSPEIKNLFKFQDILGVYFNQREAWISLGR